MLTYEDVEKAFGLEPEPPRESVMKVTDEQIERILRLTATESHDNWYGKSFVGTTEVLSNRIRDILKPVEPEEKPMLEWKDGPPKEPGIYVIDCSKTDDFGCEYYEQDVIDGWNEPAHKGHITRHYGPIPEPVKPLPDKVMFFKCKHTEDGSYGFGRYSPEGSGWFDVLWSNYTSGSRYYSDSEYKEWIKDIEWIDT